MVTFQQKTAWGPKEALNNFEKFCKLLGLSEQHKIKIIDECSNILVLTTVGEHHNDLNLFIEQEREHDLTIRLVMMQKMLQALNYGRQLSFSGS